MLDFATSFRNSVGAEVAGTWFDRGTAEWRISTVPLRGFPTEQEAVDFYNRFCDPETGIPGRIRRDPRQTGHVRTATAEGDLRQPNQAKAALTEQREALKRSQDTIAGPESARYRG